MNMSPVMPTTISRVLDIMQLIHLSIKIRKKKIGFHQKREAKTNIGLESIKISLTKYFYLFFVKKIET